MAREVENRIFVGGLSWETSERQLEDAFGRYGKILEAQIMQERDTGRPRGFGFVTFSDHRAMEDAIRDMHGRELGDRVISVNKAQPKMGSDEPGGYGGYGGGSYSSGGRGGGYGGGRDRSAGGNECFKCGRPGHFARECPSGGGGGGRFPSRSSRFSGGDRYGDRYVDDRYDGGRYAERDRVDSSRYGGGRDRYASDRYPAGGDRYGGSDRYAQNGYGKDKGYDRDGGPRDRYASGGPARYEGGSYRDRSGPYDRPSRGARPSSYDRY
ncbi:hypothetical protein ACHQM5_010116 [Ranunculus cassubicifolius]